MSISTTIVKRIKYTAAAVITVALFASTAAADNQMQPGAMCVSTNPSNPAQVTSWGGIGNPSASWMTVICPIARDGFGATGQSVSLTWVQNSNYNEQVSCSLRSKNGGSGSLLFSSSDYTTAIGDHESLSGVVSNSGTWDARFVLCSLPPTYLGNQSYVFSFRGTEI